MLFQKKDFIKQKKETIKVMKNFAESKISTEDFWNIYRENEVIYKIIVKCKNLLFSVSQIENIDISTLKGRIQLYFIIKKFFEIKKIKINPYNVDEERYIFINKIIDNWYFSEDIDYISDLINSAPKQLSKDELKTWCQKELTKKFRFDEYPPCWLTSFSWPIINNKPLTFKKMIEKLENNLIFRDYIFYDDITKEETIITQSDYK